MLKLFVYMKTYLKECILGPLFKFLEAGFELLVPLIVAAIIDKGIPNADHSYIVRMCLILLALAAVGLLCSITAQYYAAKAAVGFTRKIRQKLFEHIQGLSFTELDRLGAATLMTRITGDMEQVQTGVNLTLRLLLRSPFVVFGAMLMAFTINFKAALVFAAAIPLLFAVVFFIMLKCIPLYKSVRLKLDGVMGLTKENLSGVRVIRAFGHESNEICNFENKTKELADTQLRVGRISALMNPLTYVIINLSITVLIWTGAIKVEAGILTQGAVIALYNYMSQILVELIKFANLLIITSKSIACAKRISSLFEIETSLDSPEILKASPQNGNAVEFRHVSICYAGAEAPFLQDIHFTAAKGDIIGIIGGTGSGKSSLVNLIARFYDASEGEVLVNGINVKDYPIEELRRKIGIVPQEARLFRGTIRENMLWGREESSDEEIMQALEIAQAKALVLEKEGGLDFMVKQGGKNLSGGQRQRLTIARALLRKPEILILDDSTSALDYATDAALRKALKNLDGVSVFIVSQRASSIRHADRILMLDDGKIIASGTNEDLLNSCEIYREIYETQFKKEA